MGGCLKSGILALSYSKTIFQVSANFQNTQIIANFEIGKDQSIVFLYSYAMICVTIWQCVSIFNRRENRNKSIIIDKVMKINIQFEFWRVVKMNMWGRATG